MLRRGRNRGNDSKAGKRVVVSGKIDVSIILFVLRWLAAFPLSLGQVKELIKVIGRAHGLDFFRSQIVNDWTKDGATSLGVSCRDDSDIVGGATPSAAVTQQW